MVVLTFNPWLYQDQVLLIQAFFASLAEILNRSVESKKEKIGKALVEYGQMVAPITFNAGAATTPGSETFSVSLSFKESVVALGKKLSSVRIEEHRDHVEKYLRVQKKRIVVMMDDIDRLDKDEIHALFKLIKLTADFPYLTYVLACDKDMVAAALREKYGGHENAGREFLEKIVQVPLQLPIAQQRQLEMYCFDALNQALITAQVKLNKDYGQSIASSIHDILNSHPMTPRMIKRYANAVTFAFSILYGEVHTVDLIMIELIRQLYPVLYDSIRCNKNLYLGKATSTSFDESAKKAGMEVFDAALIDLGEAERKTILYEMQKLFPKLKSYYSNYSFNLNCDTRWNDEQRITSEHYFDRYFTYAVPSGDMSDCELVNFLEKINAEDIEWIENQIKLFVNINNSGKVVFKLRQYEEKLLSHASEKLALAIAHQGKLFPEKYIDFIRTVRMQAAILVRQLVKAVEDTAERSDLANRVITEADPIPFAIECFVILDVSENNNESSKLFDIETYGKLSNIIVDRIRNAAKAEYPLFAFWGKDALRALFIWKKWSNDNIEEYIADSLKADPKNTSLFLELFYSDATEVESGRTVRNDIDQDNYSYISQLVNPEIVYNALFQIYGKQLSNPQYEGYKQRPLNEQLAHQFSYLHLQAKERDNKDK